MPTTKKVAPLTNKKNASKAVLNSVSPKNKKSTSSKKHIEMTMPIVRKTKKVSITSIGLCRVS